MSEMLFVVLRKIFKLSTEFIATRTGETPDSKRRVINEEKLVEIHSKLQSQVPRRRDENLKFTHLKKTVWTCKYLGRSARNAGIRQHLPWNGLLSSLGITTPREDCTGEASDCWVWPDERFLGSPNKFVLHYPGICLWYINEYIYKEFMTFRFEPGSFPSRYQMVLAVAVQQISPPKFSSGKLSQWTLESSLRTVSERRAEERNNGEWRYSFIITLSLMKYL